MLKPTLKQTGETSTERALSKVLERCFFGLWSYTNLFTDHGKKGANTTGKELCDLLVIFGNEIIIFSDKAVDYKPTEDCRPPW